MKAGQSVKVKVYGGEAVVIVVEADDWHVNVCKMEEFEAAKRERRQPTMVGFPITDVIGIIDDEGE